MRIDLSNYEEWMIEYLDGNLDTQQSKEIEAFLLKYPHIAEEIEGISDIQLDKNENISIDPVLKSSLIQPEIQATNHISEENYQLTFASYHEDDFDENDEKELNIFLIKNEFLRKDFESYESLKLKADMSVTFPDKDQLFKKEKKLIPVWAWSGLAAAILIIGFWIGSINPEERLNYTPEKINAKTIHNLAFHNPEKSIPQKSDRLIISTFDETIETQEFKRLENPSAIASLTISKLKINKNDWQIQMELMQGYAFERNQLKSQVNWAAIPSENSKKGFSLISSFLWKTTKAQVQSFSEDVFSDDIQALASGNLETLTGGMISVKRPAREVE